MKLVKYFLVMAVTAVICVFGVRWHYTGRIAVTRDVTQSSYYRMKQSMFTASRKNEGCIMFLGDSITDFLSLDELLPGVNTLNRGVAADTTSGVLHRLDEAIRHNPAKLFLLIGTNDIGMGVSPEKITDNIRTIISRFRKGSPGTKIYLQTILPTSSDVIRPEDKINTVNTMMKALASETGCEVVDLYALFSEDGKLPGRYTFDGLHLNGEGSVKWIEHIKPLL